MPQKILVASVHPAFGELLRLSLEKSGRYSVRLEGSCAEALDELGKNLYAMAVLDADLKDAGAPNALADIVRRFSMLPLILFPPQNNPQHPLMKGLTFQAWIRKPFYLPELLEAADAVSAGRRWAPGALVAPTTPADLAWLKDDLQPGSQISNLLSEDCLAALFLTLGGPIIAQVGSLPPSAGEEIAGLINKSWREDQSSDLVRYAHLEATEADVMLYVTLLEKPLLAALVFSPTVPLMRARSVAVQAVRGIHIRPPAAAVQPVPQIDQSSVNPEEQAAVWQAEVSQDGEAVDGLLLELLASAPSPDPVRAKPRKAVDWLLDESIVPVEEQEISFPWEVEQIQPADPWDFSRANSEKPTQPVAGIQPITSSAPVSASSGSTPAEANQIFTCILIPRLIELPLTGNLKTELEQGLPDVCIRFGWNLRNMQISPQALQFTVEVAPSISAGYLVRVLRQQTTQRIAETFPQYAGAQGASDFWAPGFLIVSGSRSPAPQVLQDFIRQTRRRQGLTPTE